MTRKTLPRLRLHRTTWPRHALVLADTPRPNCPQCAGDGGTARDYGHPDTGEYDGTAWEPCTCWNENRRWVVLPLPRPRWRRGRNDYRTEPPF
jgi:hypothetical protein